MEMALTFNDVTLTPISHRTASGFVPLNWPALWGMDAKAKFRAFAAAMPTSSRRK